MDCSDETDRHDDEAYNRDNAASSKVPRVHSRDGTKRLSIRHDRGCQRDAHKQNEAKVTGKNIEPLIGKAPSLASLSHAKKNAGTETIAMTFRVIAVINAI